jgi:hypothetical protein
VPRVQTFLVVDVEDSLGAFCASGVVRRGLRGGGPGAIFDSGEVEPEECAPACFAVGGYGAAVAANDAVDDRETEAGALADRPGGEERIEDAVQRGAVHAAAVVPNGENDVGTLMDNG